MQISGFFLIITVHFRIIIISVINIVIIIIITIMFNIISHRAEILVSLVFAVTVDINQMSKVSQQYPFLGT